MSRIRILLTAMLCLGFIAQGCALDGVGAGADGGDMGGDFGDMGGMGALPPSQPGSFGGGSPTGEDIPPLGPIATGPASSSGNCGPSG